MKPIVTALTLLNTPVDINREAGRQAPVAVDYEVHLRALNTSAFFGSGGDFAFDLVPVQTPHAEQFTVSKAFASPDAPVTDDSGWMMLRDNQGNSVVVFVDSDTTLESLVEGLADYSQLQIAVGVATDTQGARMVVAFDTPSLRAFEDGASSYLPAPSLSTRGTAIFPDGSAAAFPAREFDSVQGYIWPVDTTAVYSSDETGPLYMLSTYSNDFLNAPVDGGEEAWNAFFDLSAPILEDGRWALEPAYGDEDLREAMEYDTLRSWRQRTTTWLVEDADGRWMATEGPITSAIGEFEIEMMDYGLVPPPTIAMD